MFTELQYNSGLNNLALPSFGLNVAISFAMQTDSVLQSVYEKVYRFTSCITKRIHLKSVASCHNWFNHKDL